MNDNDLENKQKLSKKKIGIISGIAIILAVCIATTICIYIDRTQNDIPKLLNKGDITAVSNIYKKRYAHRGFEKQQEFIHYIDRFMSQKYDEYNNESVSYDQVMSIYNKIQTQIVEANEIQGVRNIANYQNDMLALKTSKDAYYGGESNLANKDYAKAIKEYSKVIQEDNNYPKAQEKSEQAKNTWKSETLIDADKKIELGEYESAISTLQALSEYFPTETSISEKINQVKTKVVNHAIEQAANDFTTIGYQKSIADLQEAVRITGDSAQLNSEIEKYSAYIPVEIYYMECTERSKKRISKSEIGKDNTNSIHKNALSAYHRSFGDENQYEVYPLLGKYDTLTFEAYRNNDDRTKQSDEIIGINIYGDNILLKGITIDKSFVPQTFSINISGVQKLKIEFESKGTDASMWFYRLPGEISNIVATKTK